MIPCNPHELLRLRNWQGQMLKSRDLRDQLRFDDAHRWWHNRALHNTYGIARGFGVEQVIGNVHVAPGLAYDCFGRELILPEIASIPVPRLRSDQDFVLIAGYAEGTTPDCSPGLESVAAGNLVLHWKPADSTGIQDGVPLAKFTRDGELQTSGVRHYVRPMTAPRIATGRTVPGDTQWRIWREPVVIDRGYLFSIDLKFTAELQNGPMSDGLKEVFNANHAPIKNPGASVEVKADDGWAIHDGDQEYRIVRRKQSLKVYDPRYWQGENSNEDGPELNVEIVFGAEVEIDTRRAGFTQTPCYLTQLHQRSMSLDSIKELIQGYSVAAPIWSYVAFQFLALRVPHVFAPHESGFTLRVWLPHFVGFQLLVYLSLYQAGYNKDDPSPYEEVDEYIEKMARKQILPMFREQQLSVGWYGVECCPRSQE